MAGEATAEPEPEPEPTPEATPAKIAEPEDKPKGEVSLAADKDAKTDKKKGGCSSGAPISLGSATLGVLLLIGLSRGRRRA